MLSSYLMSPAHATSRPSAHCSPFPASLSLPRPALAMHIHSSHFELSIFFVFPNCLWRLCLHPNSTLANLFEAHRIRLDKSRALVCYHFLSLSLSLPANFTPPSSLFTSTGLHRYSSRANRLSSHHIDVQVSPESLPRNVQAPPTTLVTPPTVVQPRARTPTT